MNTILITGSSSGFGLETARLFLSRGWRVVATMRTPRDDLLPVSDRLRVLAMDVTDPQSIEQAVDAAGPIDALVNNAGIGLMGAFEGSSLSAVRELFETNTLGTMAVTQAVLQQFRQRRRGVIVNVSSAITLKPLPLIAAYTASKAAVEAFSESLALELEQFNVRVRLVLPGRGPETRFSENARARMQNTAHESYADFAANFYASRGDVSAFTRSADVAEAVWVAVTDPSFAASVPVGADAAALAAETNRPAP
ncbi:MULTISPECIES: SDR family oxidoreductase [unclassified Roseateles]|uniref:SDR family oxidoreductase n=1 Tax=unclassified Roseateles TaxID=2626991 RepID=UPI0006F34038|nr:MULTISPECIES: SDR family oxidoreductase [unclassified Roseateles]KQW49566.1 dehydrogenase [Pelomonas sp. Root405]KRA75623.1 dehydrogenase [Pelomonas sp. Root662]